MVLKGTKRSFRTGNTLRKTCGQRNKHSPSVIVRHGTNQETTHEEELFITADSVEFSLNKKGRWNLPSVIEDEIKEDRDLAVAVFHRHRVHQQNDCVDFIASAAYTNSRCVAERKKARRKTYCNGLSIVQSGRGKSKKDLRKKQVVSTKKQLSQLKDDVANDEAKTEASATPKVRYDVFHPLPASSSLRFKPRSKTAAKLSGGSFQRRTHFDFCNEYDEDSNYDEGYGDNDYDGYDADHVDLNACTDDQLAHDCSVYQYRDHILLFADIVEQAFQRPFPSTPCFVRKTSSRKPNKRKTGHFSYQTPQDSDVDSCLEDSRSEASTESDTSVALSTPSVDLKVTEIPSVLVQLSRESTSPSHLADHFGANYTEALCMPRKLIFNITDKVQASVTKDQDFHDVHVPSLDLTSYIILTYICPSVLGSQSEDVKPSDQEVVSQDISQEMRVTDGHDYDMFRAQLNIDCADQDLTLRLPDNDKYDSVEELVDKIVDFITTIDPQHFFRHPRHMQPSTLQSRLRPDFSTLAHANGWHISCVSPLEAKQGLDFHSEHNVPDYSTLVLTHTETPLSQTPSQKKNSLQVNGWSEQRDVVNFTEPQITQVSEIKTENISQTPHESDSIKDKCTVGTLVPALPSQTFCNICFEELCPGSAEGPMSVALSECGHWFCEACWRSHILVSMKENTNAGKLQCPEFRCKAEVDIGTLLSLHALRDIMLQQRRRAEEEMMKRFRCKWCPNPSCGRIVLLTAACNLDVADPSSMSCPCGHKFCLRCHGDAHWPLTCDDLTRYHAILRRQGHLDISQEQMDAALWTVVLGKTCPSCHRFMERFGGCPYMTCICRHSFWWCCRKPTSVRHKCPEYFKITDFTNTVAKRVRITESKPFNGESTFYDMALVHRTAQCHRRAKDAAKHADKLCEALIRLASKGVDVGALVNGKHQQIREQVRKPAPLQSELLVEASEELFMAETESSVLPTIRVRSETGEGTGHARGKKQGRLPVKTETFLPSSNYKHVRHAVLSATSTMVKLKLELHSVTENTAAWLHLHQHPDLLVTGTVRKVKDSLDHLHLLSSSLDALLTSQSPRYLAHTLVWFRRLKQNVHDSFTVLAGLVN